jgi:SAM-dependent methyltransferase
MNETASPVPSPRPTPMKPYAESSEVNKVPILAVLKDIFAEHKRVLEIASGTGQHAVYFGRELPHLTWQPSELPQHLPGIQAWLDEAQLPNVLAPLAIDVNDAHWPFIKSVRPELVEGQALSITVRPEVSKDEGLPDSTSPDAIFNANTVHIISWPEVECMFAHIARVIEPGGCVCLYGPYNYGGKFTSESNARFDAWLKSRDPNSGVRDFEAVNRLATSHGLELLRDIAMPSNNRILVWVAKAPI